MIAALVLISCRDGQPVNCGRTARPAHRRVLARRVRADAPLRNVTRAETAPMGSDTVTVRRPGRTTAAATRRPLTENTMRRIGEPVTVTRARVAAQPGTRRTAFPRETRVPLTTCAGATAAGVVAAGTAGSGLTGELTIGLSAGGGLSTGGLSTGALAFVNVQTTVSPAARSIAAVASVTEESASSQESFVSVQPRVGSSCTVYVPAEASKTFWPPSARRKSEDDRLSDGWKLNCWSAPAGTVFFSMTIRPVAGGGGGGCLP